MKYSELKDLTSEELHQKEATLRDDLFKLRLRQASTQVENPMRIRQLRHDIARVQTALRALAATTAPKGGA
jgi:large subunit ribosomal protein L29